MALCARKKRQMGIHTLKRRAAAVATVIGQLLSQLPLCSQSAIRAGGMAFVLIWCGFVVALVIL